MLRLRRFLCSCFGFLAFIFAIVSIVTIPTIVLSVQKHGLPTVHTTKLPMALAIVIAMLARLILLIPAVLAFLYGTAWWKVRSGKPAARLWAIAASLSNLLLSVPLFVSIFLIWTHGSHSNIARRLILQGALVAIGVAGLVVFTRRDALNPQPLTPAKPPRIAGDGTSRLFDGIAWLLAVAGYFTGQWLWMRWARAQHLPMSHGYAFWLLFAAAALIETTAHECGHAFVGVALGMRLRAFIVGPFQWFIRDGEWKFQFVLAKFLSAGGATTVVPTNPNQSRRNDIWMIASGPLASLVTGLLAWEAAVTAKGRLYEPAWEMLALMATFGLVAFAVNLIPLRPGALYSDGAQIYQLLAGGPWADLHRALSIVGSTLVTSLRPRDFDIEAIQRAAASFTHGIQALLLRMYAVSCFLDRGEMLKARQALAQAESVYEESASDIPAELHTAFVFDNAFLCRDAANARKWWERMEAKKPTHLGVDYWLARSGLLWIEDHLEEAREAWGNGNVLAQQLPPAGCYEFDRYRYEMLRRVLDAAPSADRNDPVGLPVTTGQ